MSQLSDNLTAKRKLLGLSVKRVWTEMSRRGHPLAYVTVAGWFNGNRGIGKMEHLQALCKILQTDVDAVLNGDIELSEQTLDVLIARESRRIGVPNKELVLALMRSLPSAGS